ncbi:MAG: helix-turn-helix domain-containing protein [Clostridia bacterium]|nr:helix-turn-helix domain-containing protein [Clostridia bacterium]
MDSELNQILKSIKDKTGIDLVVFAEGMKFFATTDNSIEILTPTDKDFTGVYQDIMTGNTYFRFKYKNANLIGYVRGVGSTERNYANLISDLIESLSGRELQLSQEEYFKSILLGECNRPQIQKFQRKFNIPDKPCFALAINVEGAKRQDVMDVLSSFGDDYPVCIDETSYAYVKFEDGVTDYQSASDFAEFLVQSLKEETGITANVGVGITAKSMAEISTSFQQGLMAVRMCNVMNSKGSVHTFKEYLLLKMLEDLPKFKLSEYLNVLLDDDAKEIFTDAEMTNTAEEFLENSLNVSETSRKLYLHRNTLMYRLDKIERETGLNIRKFSDAVTFRLITILFKLLK